MKKSPIWLLFAICGAFFMLFFAGCKQITNTVPENGAPYYVKNSDWTAFDIASATAGRSAETLPSLSVALEIVETYNAANTDNQLFLDVVDVPITEAPTVSVYIVNEGDYAPLAEYLDLPRAAYASNKWAYDTESKTLGGLLFVDTVPPVPVVIEDLRTDYEKYAIYAVITATGKIYLEEHCQDTWDASCHLKNWHYTTTQEYFEVRLRGITQEATWSGWTVYSGCIYTEPVEEIIE